MNCLVCKQPLDAAPHVEWFKASPFTGAHHLKCPRKSTGSDDQRRKALANANVIRLARAELKRSIAGGYPVADALSAPAAQSMSLYSLLCSQCQWGPVKTERFLKPLAISPYRLIEQLTERQRAAVVAGLENTQP